MDRTATTEVLDGDGMQRKSAAKSRRLRFKFAISWAELRTQFFIDVRHRKVSLILIGERAS